MALNRGFWLEHQASGIYTPDDTAYGEVVGHHSRYLLLYGSISQEWGWSLTQSLQVVTVNGNSANIRSACSPDIQRNCLFSVSAG